MVEKLVYNYVNSIGCCKACCLRYLSVKSAEVFNNIDTYVKKMEYSDENNINDETEAKKAKSNPCVVCLGLLQDFFLDEVVDKVCENEKIKSYDTEVFTCSVSFPMCVQIREKSVVINLVEKFPEFISYETVVTQLNKTWKWRIKDRLSTRLNKTFEPSETCNFSINITVSYDPDVEELSVLLDMQPSYFNTRREQKRKFCGELFSRKAVQTVLDMTNSVNFSKFSDVPPKIANKHLFVENIDCVHNSIYIAGRYCKFSRELSQTPWFINNVKMMESSVQEKIFEPFIEILQISEDGLKFSSSGREDVDVRCLGNGRPFYLEYLDPKKTKFSYEEFREIEKEINKDIEINIRDLQLVAREDLIYIKQGEETKTKQYEAICACKNEIPTSDSLEKLSSIVPLSLKQKTPIRVLHRRPLATRERKIFSMKAEKIPGAEENVFKLFLTTQAGTYVKEFIHGDFGRTVPNLSQLLSLEVDILELDVMAIDLDWPKPVEKP